MTTSPQTQQHQYHLCCTHLEENIDSSGFQACEDGTLLRVIHHSYLFLDSFLITIDEIANY